MLKLLSGIYNDNTADIQYHIERNKLEYKIEFHRYFFLTQFKIFQLFVYGNIIQYPKVSNLLLRVGYRVNAERKTIRRCCFF